MSIYQVIYQVTRTRRAFVQADSPEAAEAWVVAGEYDIELDEVIDGGFFVISYDEVAAQGHVHDAIPGDFHQGGDGVCAECGLEPGDPDCGCVCDCRHTCT